MLRLPTARLLRHGSDIEDVVQETFLTAYRDLPKLREPRLLGPAGDEEAPGGRSLRECAVKRQQTIARLGRIGGEPAVVTGLLEVR